MSKPELGEIVYQDEFEDKLNLWGAVIIPAFNGGADVDGFVAYWHERALGRAAFVDGDGNVKKYADSVPYCRKIPQIGIFDEAGYPNEQ